MFLRFCHLKLMVIFLTGLLIIWEFFHLKSQYILHLIRSAFAMGPLDTGGVPEIWRIPKYFEDSCDPGLSHVLSENKRKEKY